VFTDDTLRPSPFVRAAPVAVGVAALSVPVTAHGAPAAAVGLTLPAAVAASVGASLLGGGLVLAVASRRSIRGAVPPLLLALGGLAAVLALDADSAALLGLGAGGALVVATRGRALSDCGACADATLGAVTLHRALEGVVLAALYTADAALGLVAAGVLAVHAAAETAAVGSLYASRSRRRAVCAVCLVQLGFVAGVAVGSSALGGVPPAVETGVLAFVGGVLLAAGTREGYHQYAGRLSVPTS
jgi:hypothetical protein